MKFLNEMLTSYILEKNKTNKTNLHRINHKHYLELEVSKGKMSTKQEDTHRGAGHQDLVSKAVC